MSSTKIQFLVQMTCQECVDKVKKCLKNVKGVKDVAVNLENGSVVVESTVPTLDLQEVLESTGLKVAVKGYDGSIAAVSILETGNGISDVHGVVRFVQIKPEACVVDGTIDGLRPGPYTISVNEYGDLSNGCKNLGDIYKSAEFNGNLGVVTAEKNGRAAFRFENNQMKLSEAIGRSFVIFQQEETTKMPIACGIIARSAGLFQNPKTICACDGITIWDEVTKKNSKSNL